MPAPDASNFTRHTFVRLRENWADDPPMQLDAVHRDAVLAWQARDFPFVVARRRPTNPLDVIRLGLPLPDKTRIGFCVGRTAIRMTQPPPRLAEAREVAPQAWSSVIDEVLDLAHGIDVRVYGSLAWQFVTGLDYVRPTSDLDLLLASNDWDSVARLSYRLQPLNGLPRLDGEVTLADGSGVAWREIANNAERLLVKTPTDAMLLTRDVLVRSFAAGHC
jgi:phosphoribosyl-dephospho-CoA transferase